MSHVWKCRSYNSDFRTSRGQIRPPKRKLSRMEKKKKKEKESECCTTKSKSQCSQGSFQNAWLSQFGWLIFDKESQICVVCVCGFAKNRFSKSIPFRIFWRGWKYPLKCQNRDDSRVRKNGEPWGLFTALTTLFARLLMRGSPRRESYEGSLGHRPEETFGRPFGSHPLLIKVRG